MEVLTWQARTEKHLTLKQLEALTGIGKTTLNNIQVVYQINGSRRHSCGGFPEIGKPCRNASTRPGSAV